MLPLLLDYEKCFVKIDNLSQLIHNFCDALFHEDIDLSSVRQNDYRPFDKRG